MLAHERVDSVPFLIKICQQLQIDQIINSNFPIHGNIKRLDYGQLAVGWITFILSSATHCKSHVEDWSSSILETLKLMLGERTTRKDFSDNRLTQLLDHLSIDELWHTIENKLWRAKIDVYEFPNTKIVRVDSTASCGHHKITEDGIMQFGWTKDFRPDLPQLKLMAAAEGDTGDIIAVDLHSGNVPDDPLYVPLIKRVHLILQGHGLLYCGDCKMSSLDTRGYIAKHQDYYLTPLQMLTEALRRNLEEWVEKAINGDQQLSLVFRKSKLIAAGYELVREQRREDFVWAERLLIIKSMQWSQAQIEGLEKRLSTAINKINNLSSSSKSKKYQKRKDLEKTVEGILKSYEVQGLLQVVYEKDESKKTYQRTERRNGKTRKGNYTISKVYYKISGIEKITEKIENEKRRTGWRIYVTNTPADILSTEGAILCYRDEWKIEQQMHFLKDQPIGIRPLYVRKNEQLVGLTRFLTIALRVWTYLRTRVTLELQKEKRELSGVYKGVPTKKTKSPTGRIVMEAFDNISVIWSKRKIHVTGMSENANLLLRYFGFPETLYVDCLSKKPS